MDQALQKLGPLYKFAKDHGHGSRLLAAYYVLAYSQLEAYIKRLVEDSLNTLNKSTVALDKWPDPILGYLLHRTEKLADDYRHYSHSEDESAIIDRVAKTARKIAAWSAGRSVLPQAEATHFLERKKYPSPKNLPQLFRRLGVKDIWAVIGKAGRINGQLILSSLNDLRTDIAHEGRLPPGLSLTDFRDRFQKMRRFVAALDRGVSTHFCSEWIARADWNRAMT
ncbi:MAG: HEPN domain-containing protein [Polyangia bacterium]